uniref:Uncharacterized protein n=1 Tax=Panagrolaimus sp. JU765 TaxID=591449 RepID=A0AC34RR77_9BILA
MDYSNERPKLKPPPPPPSKPKPTIVVLRPNKPPPPPPPPSSTKPKLKPIIVKLPNQNQHYSAQLQKPVILNQTIPMPSYHDEEKRENPYDKVPYV